MLPNAEKIAEAGAENVEVMANKIVFQAEGVNHEISLTAEFFAQHPDSLAGKFAGQARHPLRQGGGLAYHVAGALCRAVGEGGRCVDHGARLVLLLAGTAIS